jgi:phosphatidate cytidylyltransferase
VARDIPFASRAIVQERPRATAHEQFTVSGRRGNLRNPVSATFVPDVDFVGQRPKITWIRRQSAVINESLFRPSHVIHALLFPASEIAQETHGMTPSEALHSPVFQFYAAVALGILLVAGLVLATLRWGLHKNVEHAWKSYCGWLVMVPLLLLVLFLGRIPSIVFFTAVGIFGFKEFARATGLYRDWYMTGAVYLAMIATGCLCLPSDPQQGVSGWYGMFMAWPVFAIAGILLIPILRNRVQGQLQLIALSIVGYIYFGWMFGHLAFLANAKQAYAYLLYVLFAVEINDVAAFTFGKLFGRHPLRSNISPKKTWEGALGALGVSLVLPWLLHFTFPHLQARDLIYIGLIVGIGGQLGDLAISVIKRDLGIKDMGATIPGHGGILDRIDSLIYVAPLFLHTVRYFHDLY